MIKTATLAAYLYLAGIFAQFVVAAEFHVATNGSDANPGTKEKPFATLVRRARDAMRGAGGGDVVYTAARMC